MMNMSSITTSLTLTEEVENIVTHETIWPTQMEEKALLVLVTVFYVVVFVSGLLGNLSVCLVIIKSSGLHSAMNYYLISLAVADITIIILGNTTIIIIGNITIILGGNITIMILGNTLPSYLIIPPS